MTEAITITAIIVGGIVALAWVLLHFAFKAWSAERADAKAEQEELDALTPPKQSPAEHLEALGYTESAEQVALRHHLTAERVIAAAHQRRQIDLS